MTKFHPVFVLEFQDWQIAVGQPPDLLAVVLVYKGSHFAACATMGAVVSMDSISNEDAIAPTKRMPPYVLVLLSARALTVAPDAPDLFKNTSKYSNICPLCFWDRQRNKAPAQGSRRGISYCAPSLVKYHYPYRAFRT